MRKKVIILLIIIILILISASVIYLSNQTATGRVTEEPNEYTYTKAICNESNYCEDYEVMCEENKTIKATATGFAVQHKEEWKDPREETHEELC